MRRSPATLKVSTVLPGINKVRTTLVGGARRETWYAWRGKGAPIILKVEARSDALLAAAVEAASAKAIETFQALSRPEPDTRFLDGLIAKYLAAMEDNKILAERTKADRRKLLSRVRQGLGTMETKAIDAKGARAVLLAWRGKYAKTPKTADDLLGALSTVLQWAVDGGAGVTIGGNPIAQFPRLYKSNRAEIIWRPEDLALIDEHCAPELWLAVNLAATSGLRLGDLIKLPRNAIGKDAIVWQTGKSRGRRTIIIPMTDKLRAVLATMPARAATTVLTSARKTPWTEPGLASAIRRAKLDARDKWRKAANDKAAKSPVDHLRFHDLRGTAATNFILDGLDIPDVAMILGWKKDKVEQIAARYVSGEAIGRAMIAKLQRNKASASSANDPANDAAEVAAAKSQATDNAG